MQNLTCQPRSKKLPVRLSPYELEIRSGPRNTSNHFEGLKQTLVAHVVARSVRRHVLCVCVCESV